MGVGVSEQGISFMQTFCNTRGKSASVIVQVCALAPTFQHAERLTPSCPVLFCPSLPTSSGSSPPSLTIYFSFQIAWSLGSPGPRDLGRGAPGQ